MNHAARLRLDFLLEVELQQRARLIGNDVGRARVIEREEPLGRNDEPRLVLPQDGAISPVIVAQDERIAREKVARILPLLALRENALLALEGRNGSIEALEDMGHFLGGNALEKRKVKGYLCKIRHRTSPVGGKSNGMYL